ncbi:hypothetical protein, partial [Amycolatopsis vancoresmycina]|uniref:hypothetical protein n=1 Tax=Amycolatopsis vancoresmycina TaxID=208444 RepID=UPI001F0B3807
MAPTRREVALRSAETDGSCPCPASTTSASRVPSSPWQRDWSADGGRAATAAEKLSAAWVAAPGGGPAAPRA